MHHVILNISYDVTVRDENPLLPLTIMEGVQVVGAHNTLVPRDFKTERVVHHGRKMTGNISCRTVAVTTITL